MKNTFASTVLAVTATFALGACASLQGSAPTADNQGIMTDKAGRTLYTFDKDSAGKSNCNGGCAALWPPFGVADAKLAGGAYAIVTRDDGSKQWAYQGRPLYFYAADSKPGDRNGDKQGGVWHVVPVSQAPAAEPFRSSNPGY